MGVVTTLQFFTLAVLAHLLSPSDFGLMGMVIVVIGFSQLFADMGISNAIIYHQDATREELSSLYWLNIAAGIVIFIIIYAATPLIISFFQEPQLKELLHLSAVIFLIVPFGQQFQVLLQKELQFNRLAKIDITGSFTNSVCAIGLAILGLGVFSLIWGQLAGASVRTLLLFYWGCKNRKPYLHFSLQDLKKYISFGLYQMGEKAINYFNSNLDYLLIGSLLGSKALGYYTLAYNLVLRPTNLINPVITRVAFPVFSKLQNDREKLKKGYLKILHFLSTINFPIMAGLAVAAPLLVPEVFGNQWLPSVILIQILTIVGLLRSTGNPVGSLLLSRGRADLGFKWNLALIITQIPGLYLGAKLGGTKGVAIAFAILTCIYSVFNYYILIRKMLGSCLHEYIASMWPALWKSSILVGVLSVLNLIQILSDILILIVQIICGIIVYIGLIAAFEKPLLSEIRNMIFGKEFSIKKSNMVKE